MEAELSSEVGAAGRLFKSCVDLYWALLQRILMLRFKDSQKDALRDVFGKFYFWGDGFYPYEGRLDEILANSSRLRNCVITVLVEVGEILCNEKTGLFALVDKAFDDEKLKDQRQEVRALIEGVQESLEESISSDSDSGSEVSDVGTLLEEITGDLKSRNKCLIDLSGSLDRPAADADLEETGATKVTAFEVSGPAEIWTRKVIDSFPNINIRLAERLGEANWQRYQRISQKLENAEPFDEESESEDDDDDSEGPADLPQFTASTISSADPSSIFSSAGRQTNTTGTSMSNSTFDYAFPVRRKGRITKDLRSQATYTSVMSNDQGERGWLKIPAMPKAVESGRVFRCTVCGDRHKDIISQTEWKKQVFKDIEPYICTFNDCKAGIRSYLSRKAWADHEFLDHPTSSIWTCNDCGQKFYEKASYREHAYSSHGNVLMRNQLEALVNSAEQRLGGRTERDACPFCDEFAGGKSRAFAMHVGRHMEEIALAVLPRDSEFEDDRDSEGSDQTQSVKSLPGDSNKIMGLEPEAFSDYDASWYCAMKLFVFDDQGAHLTHSEICSTINKTPSDQDNRVIPSDIIIPYIQKHRPELYKEVTMTKRFNWESMAKTRYATHLQKKNVDDLARSQPTSTPSRAAPHGPASLQDQDPPRQTNETSRGPRIGLDDFNFLAVIGKGNFSKIMLAEKKVSKDLFAIKIIKKAFIIENDEVNSIGTEKRVFLKATQNRHPFIVNLHASFQTETRLYFVMEYISGGDLMLHIQRGQFGLKRSQIYSAEVCLAMEFMHGEGIMFRDIKLDNVLLCLDGHIKITDFGLCKEDMWFGSKTKTFCGTPEFMAPEIILDKPYGRPVDWWALGVMLYQMLTQQSPFRGEDEDEIYDAILADEPVYPIQMPRDSVEIVQKLLTRDPDHRLGSGPTDAQEIKNHAFFKTINWDDLYHKRVPAPSIPTVSSKTDISNFDNEFTSMTPVLTPVDTVLTQAMQEQFRGFSISEYQIQKNGRDAALNLI